MKDKINPALNITNCDNEPIHIPGAIQSHGIMVAINLHSGLISCLSQNVQALAGVEATNFLHKDFGVLAGAIHLESLDALPSFTSLIEKKNNGESFDSHNSKSILIKAKPYNLIYHISGDELIVEIEPDVEDQLQLPYKISQIINHILKVSSLDILLDNTAKEIKKLINYDRVMIYKFSEEGHGQVIAEEMNDNLEPFLGLYYPASDIPKQARELYKLNLTRLIADAEAETSPIITYGSNKKPLDLTHSQLRAVSPIHIQYLKNMGVKSSFSISLVSKGELWGLIACHNYSPRFINYNVREISKLVGQIVSSFLEYRVEEEEQSLNNSLKENVIILQSLIEKEEIVDALTKNEITIRHITDATGAVLIFDNSINRLGTTPSDIEIKNIANWLIEHSDDDIFFTSSFPRVYEPAAQYSQIASGILCCILSRELKEMIIWFKPEQIQQVIWAGNPNKAVEMDNNENNVLTPRKSFEQWTEIVKHTSQKWTKAEVDAVEKIREHLIYAIKRKTDEIRKLNEQLRLAYEELDAFSFTVSHDLKAPLTAIKAYAELLESSDSHSPETVKNMLSRIIKSSNKMNVMMDEILKYSRVGRETFKKNIINMPAVLNEIKLEIFSQNKYQGVEFETGEIVNFPGDEVMISQLFSNLLSNAVKYSSKAQRPKVIIDSILENNEVIYSISDNGIGIDMKYDSHIFELFKRSDNVEDIEGTGVGLAIVKRIAEKHNGRIRFESELGKGTTFYITFSNG